MTFTKKQLVNAYVLHIVENMDLSDLMGYACDYLQDHYAVLSVDEVIAELKDIAPEILEELVEEFGATQWHLTNLMCLLLENN